MRKDRVKEFVIKAHKHYEANFSELDSKEESQIKVDNTQIDEARFV